MMFDSNDELVEKYGSVINTTLSVKKWGYPGGDRTPTGNVDVISILSTTDCMGNVIEKENITTFNVKLRTGHTLNTLADDLFGIVKYEQMKYPDAHILNSPTFNDCLDVVKEAKQI